MRFLASILSTCLLLGGSLAKEKSSAQRFQEFSLLSRTTTPIVLNEATYKSLTTAPRDYSVAMLLTAHEARLGCQMCREFQPEFDLVSKSWLNGDKKQESRLLFGMLDFAEGRDVFISLGLQTVPVLLLFPPTEGPHAVESKEPARYDFSTGAISAEQVQTWLAKNLPNRPHPPVKRPINWLRVLSTVTIVLGAGTVLVTASPYVLPIVQNRNIWATVSLIAILLFTSGHMFNHIRNVPYVTGDGHGGISYFANGFQTQFGLETQIVAALYGFLSFCAISLATKVPRMTDAKTQQVAVLVWGVMLFLLYSFLLSIFRIKNGGYPFSLPPFM